jgi:type II pantothenate kinase
LKLQSHKKTDTRKLATAGVLAALIVVMTVVPYTGYIYYGLIEITTLHIVVAIGAVMLGWEYGAILGCVWGVTCVLRALTNPLWLPFVNPLVSVVPRIFVGAVAGLAATGLRKAGCKQYVVASLSAAAGTLVNTFLVLSALKLFSADFAGMPLLNTIYSTLIGVNGVIELVAAVLIVPAVIAALQPRALTLGVDIGTSTTKLALVKGGRCIKTMLKPDDQTLTDALEAFGATGVKRIAVTGVGASYLKEDLLGIPTAHVDEFTALSRGAAKCAGKHNCLVVSVGTGTSFVRVTPFRSWHMGGTGLGGGLLKGLAQRLCGVSDMNQLQALATKGDLHEIDLQIQDICVGPLGNLKPENTAANMGKLSQSTRPEDLAAGLCNLIFQAIGVMAALTVDRRLTKNIVLVGTITDWPIAQVSLAQVEDLHHVHFIVPEHAAFATAIGATIGNE